MQAADEEDRSKWGRDAAKIEGCRDATKIEQPGHGTDGVVTEPGVVEMVDFTGDEAAALVNERK